LNCRNAKIWYKLSYRYARKRLFHIDGLSERYFIDTNGVIEDSKHRKLPIYKVNGKAIVYLLIRNIPLEYCLAWLVLGTFYPRKETWTSNLERDIVYADENKMNCRLDNLLWK
jgi:hypothetical protein